MMWPYKYQKLIKVIRNDFPTHYQNISLKKNFDSKKFDIFGLFFGKDEEGGIIEGGLLGTSR